MGKNGTAAGGTKSQGSQGKKKTSATKKMFDAVGKMLDRIEAMSKTPVGTNPAVIFATPIDRKAEDCAGFKSTREYFMAVVKAGSGKGIDKRLEPLRVKAAGSDEATTQSNPYGGFLIPVGFIPEPLKIDPEADPIGAATTKIPMGNPIVNIPARVDKDHRTSVAGGLVVGRKAETLAASSSRMKFEQVAIEAHNLFGLAFAAEELLTDSPQSFVAILQAGFNDQFTYHLIDERINGTGVGQYLGVLNSPCLVSVAKETGQRAASITFENIVKMRSRCWSYGKAIWLANHDTLPELATMAQVVGTGGLPAWQPSAREDHPDMLMGRPLIFSEYPKTVGTKGDLILGVWKEYLEGQYQPMQQEESIHVRFIEHERTFKIWVRNGGAPWWKESLRPKQSTQTLSPFVVLDDRA